MPPRRCHQEPALCHRGGANAGCQPCATEEVTSSSSQAHPRASSPLGGPHDHVTLSLQVPGQWPDPTVLLSPQATPEVMPQPPHGPAVGPSSPCRAPVLVSRCSTKRFQTILGGEENNKKGGFISP